MSALDGMQMKGPMAFLACDWGKRVNTPDDKEVCWEMAVKRMVLYDGRKQGLVQFCPKHARVALSLTTPRPDDQIRDEDR